jgi:hypothetical protein
VVEIDGYTGGGTRAAVELLLAHTPRYFDRVRSGDGRVYGRWRQ